MSLEVLFVPKDNKGDLSVAEVRVLRHLHQHFLHNAKAVAVGRVHHEKYTVDVRIEETPVLAVPALPTHVINHTLLVIEGQGYFLYVYIWCCCIVFVCVLWD